MIFTISFPAFADFILELKQQYEDYLTDSLTSSCPQLEQTNKSLRGLLGFIYPTLQILQLDFLLSTFELSFIVLLMPHLP